MGQYFDPSYAGGSFVLFSFGHNVSMLVTVLAVLFVRHFRRELRETRAGNAFRYGLAALLLLSEASLDTWLAWTGQYTLDYALPLQLCSISLFLSVIMLLTKNYTVFEFTYLAGMGGALQAIITPDLGSYGYPHFRTWEFFIAHGAIVVACFYMIFVERYRPTFASLWRAFLLLNGTAVLVGLIDWLTGGNYMFLAHKPYNPSLLDLLGPWPWYLLVLEGIAVVMFLILYAPFSVLDLRKRRARG
ncbi:MAG: TIGR02206 family membrane protein [Tumebacillaceae bacterium]